MSAVEYGKEKVQKYENTSWYWENVTASDVQEKNSLCKSVRLKLKNDDGFIP